MRICMKHVNRQDGFTLIEMLVAMGILVVGVTTILGLLTFGAALQRTAERQSEAALAAEQVVDDLRNLAFPVNPDGTPGEPSTQMEFPVQGHPRLTASVDLKRNPALVGEYFATILIQWRERGQLKGEEFRTILQRETPFGARLEAIHSRPAR